MKKYPKHPAILIDTTRCTGCEQCVAACKEENGKLQDNRDMKDRPWRGQDAIDSLSSTRFCTILRRPGDHYVRQQCRHCLDPACVSACLVGAMQKSPEGPVIYDEDLCMGCRYCLVACPYGIPRYDWDRAIPYVRKCTMCYENRLKLKKVPACVEACPEEAAVFDERSELLNQARDRLDAEPDKYVQHIYGEHEVGGTSVLYISDIPLSFLGWQPASDTRKLPDLTWASLKKVPPVILAMGGLMGGIYWMVGRRMKMAAEAEVGTAPQETETSDPSEVTQDSREDDD